MFLGVSLGLALANAFLVYFDKNKIAHLTFKIITIVSMLISLFYSPYQNI